MRVIVLIADIVNSKKILHRAEFQKKLKINLDLINRSCEDIISPYTITLGDEFQSIYSKPDSILKHIISISTTIYPHKARYSLCIGELSTELNRESSIGMDGPAFHVARNEIDLLKKVKFNIIKFSSLTYEDFSLVNSSLHYSMAIMATWKENMLIIFNELLKGSSIDEIAEIINVSQRSIYKSIETHKLHTLVELFNQCNKKIIEEINREH